MLSLAMIRVEPGSTPGIGITTLEHFFFVFCGMCFCFSQGELVACHFAAAAVLEGFYDLPCYLTDTWLLGYGDYILHHQVRQSR